MIRKMTVALCALLLMCSMVHPALAQTAPDQLVKTTADEVLGAIKTTKDRRALVDVVEKKVIPHFDFQAMTRAAASRNWAAATPEQRKALENAFRTLLVTTYTAALTQSASTQQSVEVKPVAGNPGDDVTVKTMVNEPGRKPIAVDYRLTKSGNDWKVIDVLVENLSLVNNYRSTFDSEVAKSGVDGLVKALEAKNKQNAG